MATKVLKLTSQEDIIGDYEERDGKCFIGQPAKLIMMPTENGGMGMGIMPWVPYTDADEVEIKQECIMLQPMEPAQDIRNEYSKRFGSGIVAPVPGDLIL